MTPGSTRALALLVATLPAACSAITAPAPPPRPATASAPTTDEPSVRPGANAAYLENGEVAEWVKRFESNGREIYDRRQDILRAAGVSTGLAVADIGAGTGLFT